MGLWGAQETYSFTYGAPHGSEVVQGVSLAVVGLPHPFGPPCTWGAPHGAAGTPGTSLHLGGAPQQRRVYLGGTPRLREGLYQPHIDLGGTPWLLRGHPILRGHPTYPTGPLVDQYRLRGQPVGT